MHKRKKQLTGETYFTRKLPFYIGRFQENYENCRHDHDFIEIIIVEEGLGFHYINEETIRVKKGDIFLIPMGNEHVFRPSTSSSENQLFIYNVLISPDKLSDLLKEADSAGETQVMSWLEEIKNENSGYVYLEDKQNQCLSLIRHIYMEYQTKQPGYHLILQAKLVELMIKLFRFTNDYDSIQTSNKRKNMVIEDILSYIEENYYHSLTLTQLADMMLVSERQFAREFKKYTNQSFIKYLQNIRVEKSCHLLQSTNYTVQEVCYMVGYSNVEFFRALFVKKVGTTPGEYKKTKEKK